MKFANLKFEWENSPVYRATLIGLIIANLFLLYIYGIQTNPPGFYLDESAIAYNAYQVSQTGRGEFGDFMPLYFPVFQLPPPHYYLAYINPVYVYAQAALFTIFPPSILLARIFSATAGFLAALLLGLLAYWISQRRVVGIIVALTALITPCLFEVSRLVLEPALFPLVLMIFLITVYRVHQKLRWSYLDVVSLAGGLALITYTYTSGRLLGPAFALGLICFATSKGRLFDIGKTWIAYALTLIPIVVYVLNHPGAITQRFDALSYIKPGKSYAEILTTFLGYYYQCLSLKTLLLTGDLNLRHHIPEIGIIYGATFFLVVSGLLIVLFRHLNDAWWRFILFGLLVSPVPSSLTVEPVNVLRLIPLPIFLLIFTIPALDWLFGESQGEPIGKRNLGFSIRNSLFRLRFQTYIPVNLFKTLDNRTLRQSILIVVLIFTIVQTVSFQIYFQKAGTYRGPWFDEAYPRIFATALAIPKRPIYLVDGYWGQASSHAKWYATIERIDLSNFVYVKLGSKPPSDSIVISTEENCTNCELLMKDDKFLLYHTR